MKRNMSRHIFIYYYLFITCCAFAVLSFVIYLLMTNFSNGLREEISPQNNWTGWSPSLSIPLVTVVCSSIKSSSGTTDPLKLVEDLKAQKEEIRVMLGTLLYFSSASKWIVYIVTDTQETFDIVTNGLEKSWPKAQYQRLQLRRRGLKIPIYKITTEFLNIYRLCSCQKLFLELVFPDYDSLVYIETNVLFSGSAEQLWNEFGHFNQTQALGASPEPWHLNKKASNVSHIGLNTGVLALNLTRLKSMPHGGFGYAVIHEFHQLTNLTSVPVHEQHVVDILLKKFPHFLYEMEYKWNFAPSDCSEFAFPCKLCPSEGITIINEANNLFYKNFDLQFRVIYYVMNEMTKNLTISPKDLLLLYEGAMNTFHTFDLGETICYNFSDFFQLTSHAIRKMVP